LSGEEYVIQSNHSEDLHSHLTSFLEGLKRKSKYAVVVQDASQVGKIAACMNSIYNDYYVQLVLFFYFLFGF
jgi:hypothetical protein